MKKIIYPTIILAILMLTASDIIACSCGQPSQKGAFKDSATVFIGKIEEITEKEGIKFQVLRAWKGVEKDSVITLGAFDIEGCDYDFEWVKGKEFLIYAQLLEGKLFLMVDCSRNRAVGDEEAREDIKNMDKIAKDN